MRSSRFDIVEGDVTPGRSTKGLCAPSNVEEEGEGSVLRVQAEVPGRRGSGRGPIFVPGVDTELPKGRVVLENEDETFARVGGAQSGDSEGDGLERRGGKAGGNNGGRAVEFALESEMAKARKEGLGRRIVRCEGRFVPDFQPPDTAERYNNVQSVS